MLDKKVKVKAIQDVGARSFLVTLHAPEQALLVRPGQFIMIKCTEGADTNPLLRRPFTIFGLHRSGRSGRPDGIELLVKNVGAGTSKLVTARTGALLDCLGPQGRGFALTPGLRSEVATACLVAGGVGIAPLLLLAESLLAQHIEPILFYGGTRADDLVLRERFEALGIDVIYVTEDGSLGERGLVTKPLARYLELNPRQDIRVYTCGPWGMMKAVHELAARHSIKCEASLEARMGCGMGACIGCVVGSRDEQGEAHYLRACIDGPVIDSRRIDWNMAPV